MTPGLLSRIAQGRRGPLRAETADYLAKARATFADARQVATLPPSHVAGREAYYAAFHAAEAHFFEQTGKVRPHIATFAASSHGWRDANHRSAATSPVSLRPPTSLRRPQPMASAQPLRRTRPT